MTEQKDTNVEAVKERGSYENWEPELNTPADVCKALEIALDYRGDITVTKKDGTKGTGFLFNCEPDKPDPFFEYFEKGKDEKSSIFYREVAHLKFSAIDPAAGRSWELWVKKVEDKKKALAEGRDIGDIEPELMPMDD